MHTKIKETIEDCNLNFLLGSGLSAPYLKTLGDIENLLTKLEEQSLSKNQKVLIKASLYKSYFEEVISKNTNILEGKADSIGNQVNYSTFLKAINTLLLNRKSTILSKEANLFTTNIDICLEKALEDLNLEYNDGFNGRFLPSFSLSNFKKAHFKKSLHYDNVSELPIFNLYKLHGALSWETILPASTIHFSNNLQHIRNIQAVLPSGDKVLKVEDKVTIEELVAKSASAPLDPGLESFLASYEKLPIVNPTKEKFKLTLLNQTYYELLRIYSNELEKENTVLFAMGFSFADEHIREITLRAANSNPTLLIYVFAHESKAKDELIERLKPDSAKNNNIRIIAPPTFEDAIGLEEDQYAYDFAKINEEVFSRIANDEDLSAPVEEME